MSKKWILVFAALLLMPRLGNGQDSKAVLASQYVSAGKTQIEAQKEVAALNACFGTYEVPPENRNHPASTHPARLRQAQTPIEK